MSKGRLLLLSIITLVASPTYGAVVTSCDEAGLRAAMDAGGTVTFACDGTIVLAHAILVPVDVALDGTGRDVRISGNDAVRLFHVSPGLNFSVTNIALVNAQTNHGAAILNDGGNVTLVNCAMLNNTAIGAPAVFNSDEANASGGAIFNRTGMVAAVSCVFSNNHARGGSVPPGLRGGLGNGGAIINQSGDVEVANCQFVVNSATGGQGGGQFIVAGTGGGASGGVLHSGGGVVHVADSLFGNNNAFGGGGGVGPNTRGNGGGASGGAIHIVNGGVLRVSSTRFITNGVRGGDGLGGSVGGRGGTVSGGAVALENSQGDASGCEFAGNVALGGLGGGSQNGGDASGGAIHNAGDLHLVNTTLRGNRAFAGVGSAGQGTHFGGALFNAQTASVVNCTIAANSGVGSAVYGQSQITFSNSIVAMSTDGGANCSGQIQDGGHNISDAGCFVHATSRNNVDPRLGPLADNGGTTLTMALLVNSPAIDAANDAGAPATDQRLVSRPQGAHADIGAFEARPGELRPHLSITKAINDVAIHLLGRTTRPYALEASTTSNTWTSIATNATDTNGRTTFTQPHSEAKQFYRAGEQ